MPERPILVALVVPRFPASSETFIVNKVRGLVQAGIDVSVLASEITETPIPQGAMARTLRAWSIETLRRRPTSAARVAVAAVSRFGITRRAAAACRHALPLNARPFDVLHFEFSGVGVAFLDALELVPNLPVVVSCRGAAEQITPLVDPTRPARLSTLFERAKAIHAVSDDMSATIQQLGAPLEKIVVNRPAVDVHLHEPRARLHEKGPPLLLSVGRLHWKKGFDLALLAIRRILDDGADVRYEIIGTGPERERLTFMISLLQLDGTVRLSGQRTPEEVREALARASLFVLPSLSEGISNAVLEAMAMEVPVVSTRAGGMGEVIDDGVNGFLAASVDPSSLEEALTRALSALQEIGSAGRHRVVEAFAMERQIEIFVEIYRRIANKT